MEDIDLFEVSEAFASVPAGLGARTRRRPRAGERQRRRDRARPSAGVQRCPPHDDPRARDGPSRRALRPADDVRGRRHGERDDPRARLIPRVPALTVAPGRVLSSPSRLRELHDLDAPGRGRSRRATEEPSPRHGAGEALRRAAAAFPLRWRTRPDPTSRTPSEKWRNAERAKSRASPCRSFARSDLVPIEDVLAERLVPTRGRGGERRGLRVPTGVPTGAGRRTLAAAPRPGPRLTQGRRPEVGKLGAEAETGGVGHRLSPHR